MVGEDILMIISKSGESPETKPLPFSAKKQTHRDGNEHSMLAKNGYLLNTTVSEEACLHNLTHKQHDGPAGNGRCPGNHVNGVQRIRVDDFARHPL
jgi:D-arabinose 5-phosphate isomerase GutQ